MKCNKYKKFKIAGPWDDEPDAEKWIDEATGYTCLARRHPRLGHWCGYVAVPLDHPLYAYSLYDEFDPLDTLHSAAHGGITWTGRHPDPGSDPDSKLWLIGFDCGHFMDHKPADQLEISDQSGINVNKAYRDLPYVRECITSLASVLAKISNRTVANTTSTLNTNLKT